MLELRLLEDSADFLATRPPKHQRQIVAKIQALRNDPCPADSKVMKGSEAGFRRADVGEYRILYRIEDNALRVALIGKRNDDEVYRRMGRK